MSTRRCILCKKKQCDTANSYYSFPKDVILQSKWKRICNLEDNIVVNNLKICSDHFDTDDFVENSIIGKRGILRLKLGAIPKGSSIANLESSIIEENCNIHRKKEETNTAIDKTIDTICVEENCTTLETISNVVTVNEGEVFLDIHFTLFLFANRGCSVQKVLEKSTDQIKTVMDWLISKLNLDISENEPGRSLGPDIITIPRIAACFPTVFCNVFHAREAKPIVTLSQLNLPEATSHAVLCPALASCVPPECVERSENVHMVFFCVHVLLDDVLHKKDKRFTELDQMFAYYKAAYGSVACPPRARAKFMKSLNLLAPGDLTFAPVIKSVIAHCRSLIQQSRASDQDLPSILAQVQDLKEKP
ncbi:hypothetical protein ABEB36_000385 [Hypothenemus hampei]|uniref:THAP-type domain-containing protein n=1 Tax=Hypothenemus hampei TaxID=57062 RepID=A0ABD1FE86_HYPHA